MEKEIKLTVVSLWKRQENPRLKYILYLGKIKIASFFWNGADRNYPVSAWSAIDGELLGNFIDEETAKKECETYLNSFIEKLKEI